MDSADVRDLTTKIDKLITDVAVVTERQRSADRRIGRIEMIGWSVPVSLVGLAGYFVFTLGQAGGMQ